MRTRTKKATFSLHIDVLEALDKATTSGMAASKNALVEQALIKELKEIKRQARKARWQEAANDPLFLQDIKEVEADFRYADGETVEMIK